MSSIFDLKTNVDELSSTNEGTSRMEYDQHPPTRDITGNNFSNGAIHFKFQTSGQKWWLPSRSYMRTRFELFKGDGVTPISTGILGTDTNIAPNMGLMSNLFQSGEFRINDKVVSRVADFMPQVDALEVRLTKSKSWLESIGETVNWWETDQNVRMAEVSSNGAIIKDQVPTVATETTTTDLVLGYGALNSVAYNATTGVITIATGGGAAAPNTNVNFQVGDQLVLTGGTVGEGALNVKLEVLAVNANTSMTVRCAIFDDIAVNNDIRFSRIRTNPPAVAPPSRRASNFETTWQPPMSLFKVGHALPSGRYELVLNPQTVSSYQQRAIESILGQASKTPTLPGGTPADFKVKIVDMYFYCATVEGPRADDITYLLDLEQTRCQSEKIDNANFAQKNFDVSPSTYALTVAYQDLRAGENTAISSSKFKSYDNAGGGLIPASSEELKLSRFFLNYAGQNLPAPDADPSFVAGTDYTVQRYTETQIYSGAYFDTGGAETIQEWHDRGAYYYFSIPRDGTDRSTRVNVHQKFDGADVTNMRILLFDHSKQVARIRVQDGRVVDVQVEDA
jgi:hypothetical protein